MIPTDARALAASRADPGAFAAVVHRHHTTVHRYLQRRVGTDLADELAADVFAVAFAQRDRYEPTQPDAAPWLLGVATNLLHRHRRTEVRRLRAYARTGVDPALPEHEDTHARLDAARRGPALAHALGSLTAAQRDTLLLHALGGLSVAEIALAMKVPYETAKTRLSRSRAAVRARLDTQAAVRPVTEPTGVAHPFTDSTEIVHDRV